CRTCGRSAGLSRIRDDKKRKKDRRRGRRCYRFSGPVYLFCTADRGTGRRYSSLSLWNKDLQDESEGKERQAFSASVSGYAGSGQHFPGSWKECSGFLCRGI